MSDKEKISYKSKLHEPILNPIQVIIYSLIILFEVIVNIIPILMGMDINPYWIMITIGIGIMSFTVTSLLRAAYPEEVPDTRITTAFKIFIKQIIDALISNKEEPSDLRSLLERIIVWAVREWDVSYQEELADAIEYVKSKLEKKSVPEDATVALKIAAKKAEIEALENT